jgi:ElaB/YqjD/DUF883 family membrane-anchored ribosome-binding protein
VINPFGHRWFRVTVGAAIGLVLGYLAAGWVGW